MIRFWRKVVAPEFYGSYTITDSSIADDAKITVDVTIGGTSPTWDDVTVFLTFKAEKS